MPFFPLSRDLEQLMSSENAQRRSESEGLADRLERERRELREVMERDAEELRGSIRREGEDIRAKVEGESRAMRERVDRGEEERRKDGEGICVITGGENSIYK